jgi:hypothetical protein
VSDITICPTYGHSSCHPSLHPSPLQAVIICRSDRAASLRPYSTTTRRFSIHLLESPTSATGAEYGSIISLRWATATEQRTVCASQSSATSRPGHGRLLDIPLRESRYVLSVAVLESRLGQHILVNQTQSLSNRHRALLHHFTATLSHIPATLSFPVWSQPMDHGASMKQFRSCLISCRISKMYG